MADPISSWPPENWFAIPRLGTTALEKFKCFIYLKEILSWRLENALQYTQHSKYAKNCIINYTWRGFGFWSTGMMRITISDSILKYPKTSHCGTETWRRIFWSISSTVIGFWLVICKKFRTIKFIYDNWKNYFSILQRWKINTRLEISVYFFLMKIQRIIYLFGHSPCPVA